MLLPVISALILVVQGSLPFPVKAVRLVEPFGAGGGVDTIARLVSSKLSEMWHQPVTVDNRPGEGSTAAPAFVAKSAPDGYTLLANSSAQAYGAALRNLPYDALRDFIPVAPLTSQAYVLVAGGSSGVGSVAELTALARQKPGELRFGSPGIGTGSHVGAVRFNEAAGITAVHVGARPTDGIVGTIAETVAGRTTYLVAPIPLAISEIRAGRLRALGVTTRKRSPLLPDVPSLAEAGITGFDYAIWYGVWAPAGTADAVVDKLSQDIARALATPDLRASLAKHGAEPMIMSRHQFARFVVTESESAARLVKVDAAGRH
jgi:tripartite-type tricarboxylate transporter receptor subunit TctC